MSWIDFKKTKKKLTSKTRIEKMRKAFVKQGGTAEQFQSLQDEIKDVWSDANYDSYERKTNEDGEIVIRGFYNEGDCMAVMNNGVARYFYYCDKSAKTLAPRGQYLRCESYGFKISDGKKEYFNDCYCFPLRADCQIAEIEKMYDYLFVQQRAHKDNWILDNVDSF